MTRHIPVKLVRVDDITEISMDLDDFESSNTDIGDDIKALKDGYDKLVNIVKPVLTGNSKPTTTERWHACRKLTDFVDTHAKFDIINFPVACAKDMGLSKSFRLMISFGREFEENEIMDSIPYSSYRVLILKMSELKRRNLYKSEKANMIRNKLHLNYKAYTNYLDNL